MALNYKHPESKFFFNNATLLQQIEKGLLCFKKKRHLPVRIIGGIMISVPLKLI